MFKKKEKPIVVGKHTNKIVGDYGEELAVKYLKKNGYKILKTKYKTEFGELDIIAQDGDYIVFVEVKYRSSDRYGMPNEAVDRRKQKKIRELAQAFLKDKHLTWMFARIDVVEILDDEIQLYKNAF